MFVNDAREGGRGERVQVGKPHADRQTRESAGDGERRQREHKPNGESVKQDAASEFNISAKRATRERQESDLFERIEKNFQL